MSDRDNLEEKLDNGEMLYNTILNRAHNGNIEEMYKHIKKNSENIDLYGDTHEKALKKYCAFKFEHVMSIYKK